MEPAAGSMRGVNAYHQILTDADNANRGHRELVGGRWDELGQWQFDFLKEQGLRPEHTLLDIGCGALRVGVYFVRYLEPGNYCGLDINPSLIKAGQHELELAGLVDRRAMLLANDRFEFTAFGRTFDCGIAVSVFTHLYLNHIGRCLRQMRRVMHAESRFFCTFFEAPAPVHIERIIHSPGNVPTHYDADPFHNSFSELRDLAATCDLAAPLIVPWNHPRDQRMMVFNVP